MSPRTRHVLFIPFGIGFVTLFLYAIRGLPAVGHYRGPYGDILNAVAVKERHSTDVVSAVNFDYRGFDTLGEEAILFASVMGATLLLRKLPSEEKRRPEEQEPGRNIPEPSDAVRILTLGLTAPTVLFGVYIVTHGQLTPGGGFQGGVVLATVPLLIYLAGDLRVFHRVVSHALVEAAEGAGIAGFVLIGASGLMFGKAFLHNVVPLGPADATVYSGGAIPLISLATGIAVSAGFVLLLLAFLQETLQLRLKHGKK